MGLAFLKLGYFFNSLMMSPEAARGLCGGGSDRTFRPPPPPHIPILPPLVAGSRSTAVLADRAGTGDKERWEEGGGRERKREREKRRRRMWVMSVPHTGILTGNVGKQK